MPDRQADRRRGETAAGQVGYAWPPTITHMRMVGNAARRLMRRLNIGTSVLLTFALRNLRDGRTSHALVGALVVDQRLAGAAQPHRLDHPENDVVAADALDLA